VRLPYKELPRASRLYIAFLIVCGIASIFWASGFALHRQADISLGIYFLLAFITSLVPVQIPFTKIRFSVDTAFVFVILMIYGPLPAIATDAAGRFVTSVRIIKNRSNYFKIPFNISSGILSVFASALAFNALLIDHSGTSSSFILPILGMTIAYYLVNSGTVALAICITEPQNPFFFWFKSFGPAAISCMTSGSIATLLLILDSYGNYLGFLVTIPMAGLIYFSQKIYLLKEEEAFKHIGELERMHLSTIESLALAIDAKDPYTHGHLYRVRHFAVELAKRLGMTDETHLTGLSFSALVHDIGKIAIPDTVLKKPGKYSDREFLIMKTHSIIGAEMLKTIPLPFPVAKIVRHHHEKWNGRGYPDGLAGNEIPFESRIITVADVYDAIRSKRPYRPQMPRDKAIRIMLEERGHTLDPAITDIFLAHIDEFEQTVELVDSKIMDIIRSTKMETEFYQESESTWGRRSEHELTLFTGLYRLFSSEYGIYQTLHEIAVTIASVLPYSALVIYLPEEGGNRLKAVTVHGLDADDLHSNTIATGCGLTGWAFENRTPIISTPTESEFSCFENDEMIYQSCLAVPILFMNQSKGVATLYSEFSGAFTAEDQDLMFKVSPILGTLLNNQESKSQPFRAPYLLKVKGM
jgi:putative nucleotidyltransferase with HDIG domain